MDSIKEKNKWSEFYEKLSEGPSEALTAMALELDELYNGGLRLVTKALELVGPENLKVVIDARLKHAKDRVNLQNSNESIIKEELDAGFVDEQHQLSKLLMALDKKEYEPISPTTIESEPIDTTSWDEFGGFFDMPVYKEVIHGIHNPGAERPFFNVCAHYISVYSVDKEKAIAALREKLLKFRRLPRVVITSFFQKPSVAPIAQPTAPDEIATLSAVVDLRGPVPCKQKWVAFCFVHAFYGENIWPEDKTELRSLGWCFEGELGLNVD